MNKNVTILLVDDHIVFLKALKQMINSYEGLEVIGQAENGKKMLDLLKTLKPDIILLDIEMPGLSGWAVMEKLVQRYPVPAVIILSQHHEKEIMLHFISLGAKAFLTKNCDPDVFIDVLYAVHEKRHRFDEDTAQALLTYRPSEDIAIKNSISARELEVLVEIANGLTDNEIAKKLNITTHTVHSHRTALMHKTKTNNAAQLTKFAIKNGLI